MIRTNILCVIVRGCVIFGSIVGSDYNISPPEIAYLIVICKYIPGIYIIYVYACICLFFFIAAQYDAIDSQQGKNWLK